MNKFFAAAFIVGFVMVDFLFFHDIFKSGEKTSFAQYLVGFLSLGIFYFGAQVLLGNEKRHR